MLAIGLASCSQKGETVIVGTEYVIEQTVALSDAYGVDSEKNPYSLQTSFASYENGVYSKYYSYTIDFGTAKEIEKLKPERYVECQEIINNLVRLNEPITK